MKDLVEHLKKENEANQGQKEQTGDMMSKMQIPNMKVPNLKVPSLK